MFFCSAVPVSQFVPEQTLEDVLAAVNHALTQHGMRWNLWNQHQRNQAAKLVRANWIYQRLDQEPIRKPLLVHGRSGQWRVLCGDTRLMSLDLLPDPPTVSAIATATHNHCTDYHDWTPVESDCHLIELIGFDPDHTEILFSRAEPESLYAADWLEIGDASTAHHLHNEQLRWQAFVHWRQHDPDAVVDKRWACCAIDWQSHGL
jgi:hypothetical protein